MIGLDKKRQGEQCIGYACHQLTHYSVLFSKLDWCDPGVWRWQLKTRWCCYFCWCWCWGSTPVCCRFGNWGLVIMLNCVQTLSKKFGQEFEVEVQAKFLRWSLVRICADVLKGLWSWILVEILKVGVVKILNFSLVEMLMCGWDFEVETDLEPWKPMKTDLEPWKTNL